MNWHWLIPVGIFVYGFACTTLGYRAGRRAIIKKLDIQIIDRETGESMVL